MPVPDFQSLMLPVLRAVADGKDTHVRDVRERVASAEGLTDADLREMLPSGRVRVFANRVAWALNYLLRAALVARVRRGVYRIADEGERLLAKPPDRLDIRYLRRFPPFVEGEKKRQRERGREREPTVERSDTPEEALEAADRELTEALEAEVLDRLRKASPSFLEQVVVGLLVAMGYGGGDASMGRVTGGAGDGGIDGTIKEDKLGLDEVYLQAKKYASGSTVGVGELRNFVGALVGARAQKGVLVTTADFTASAKDFAAQSPKRVVLINGRRLARLMVRHDVGVRVRDPHRPPILIKAIDEDFFDHG